MELIFDEIVSVAGKGGLFKILKPTKNGYIVEELSQSRKKIVLGPNHRVSLLKEISIYTTDGEGAIPLRDVYSKVKEKFSKELPVKPKDDSSDLFSFLSEVVPEFDEERVYHSDVKKLVSWYGIIMKEKPDLSFEEKDDENEGSEQKKEDKKPDSKPKAKKSAAPKKQVSSAKKGASKPTSNRKMG